MRSVMKPARWWAGLLGVLTLAAVPAQAQHRIFGRDRCPPAPCPPVVTLPETKAPDTKAPDTKPPTTPPAIEPTLPEEQFAALGGSTVSVSESGGAYIDSAIPATVLRLRLDAGYNNRRPDRAEFFYAKCGCFRAAGIDGSASGPPLPETSVDYQEAMAYLEVAANPSLSVFAEVPFRFIDPDINDNTAGLSDMNAGVKYALLYSNDFVASAQLRVYFPTGDSDRGLGNDHTSLEPGILVFNRLSDDLVLEAELRDWIPIGADDNAGNIIRYGVGLTYTALEACNLRVSPVVEVVGWTVLDGEAFAVRSFDPAIGLPSLVGTVEDSDGDTIVNAKFGVRVGIGDVDIYGGYGRALTGDTWYEEIYRLEIRYAF